MGYLNEDGLARYDGLIKNWVTLKSGTVDGVDPLLNWQKTSTASSVAFYPLPSAPIDPVVNFLFSETGPAEGTKSPDNPSTITGVSSVKVTRCGKNLIPTPPAGATTINGVTFTVNADGSTAVKGTASATCYFDVWDYSNAVKAGESYSLSGCPSGGGAGSFALRLEGSIVGSGIQLDYGSGVVFSATEGLATGKVRIRVGGGVSIDTVFHPQLELGSAATAFEPYSGADHTLPLGSTYYGGSIDLATGVMTVTWDAFSLNGTENWTFGGETATTGVYSYSLKHGFVADGGSTGNGGVCSHFVYDSGTGATKIVSWHHSKNYLYIYSNISNLDDFKTWLSSQASADTPVTICDKKVTPFEASLTPLQIYSLSQSDPYTPRINTVYSDQQSVQVGYPKSPQATSTELTNAIISLGGEI